MVLAEPLVNSGGCTSGEIAVNNYRFGGVYRGRER